MHKEDFPMRDETTISDPSFGQIRIGRSSNHKRLYGAHVDTPEVITISIHPSELIRSLGEDRYYSKNRPLIEVALTPNQFAEFITSSYSTGVPCTIMQFNGERHDIPEFEDERTKAEAEFNAKFEALARKIERMSETAEDLLTNKKSLTKADRSAILSSIHSLGMEIGSNLPFLASLYNEQLDKATTEAKAGITSYVESTVRSLGLHSLGELTALRQSIEQSGVRQLHDTPTARIDPPTDTTETT